MESALRRVASGVKEFKMAKKVTFWTRKVIRKPTTKGMISIDSILILSIPLVLQHQVPHHGVEFRGSQSSGDEIDSVV